MNDYFYFPFYRNECAAGKLWKFAPVFVSAMHSFTLGCLALFVLKLGEGGQGSELSFKSFRIHAKGRRYLVYHLSTHATGNRVKYELGNDVQDARNISQLWDANRKQITDAAQSASKVCSRRGQFYARTWGK